MDEVKHVHGILWRDGVVCNTRWAGVRMRSLLLAAGVDAAQLRGWHACFTSHVTLCQDDKDYGGSVPLDAAMDPKLRRFDVQYKVAILEPVVGRPCHFMMLEGIHDSE